MKDWGRSEHRMQRSEPGLSAESATQRPPAQSCVRELAPFGSTASVRLVHALAFVVERSGGSSARFLRAAQLDAEQEAEARLPLSELYRLIELAIELTGDPALGLHWSERARAGTFAPISYLMAHATNLRLGLETVAGLQRVFSDAAGYQLLERDDKAILRVRPEATESLRVRRFGAEMVTSSLIRVVGSFVRHARPDRVGFAYAAPDYDAEYTRVLGTTVHFEQPFTEIEFDRGLLDAAAPRPDRDVYEAMRSVAERRVRCATHGASYALRMRDYLLQQASPRRVAMETIARELGLSVRSLRRRLSLEGKSYESVRDDALALLAKRLLAERQLTIQETAYQMGFSGPSAFHRAFKRWTGETPTKCRSADTRPRPR
jgi:AraC-like DNA-binding protein